MRSSDTVQVAVRIPKDWLAKASQVAKRSSRAGLKLSRADGFRIALAEGFERLQAEETK